jgi:hypothetical protein
MEGAGPAPLRATIKQYPNNNPANPQILDILIQTNIRLILPQSNNIPITILQILKSWKS